VGAWVEAARRLIEEQHPSEEQRDPGVLARLKLRPTAELDDEQARRSRLLLRDE
jgi:hypothetical protein